MTSHSDTQQKGTETARNFKNFRSFCVFGLILAFFPNSEISYPYLLSLLGLPIFLNRKRLSSPGVSSCASSSRASSFPALLRLRFCQHLPAPAPSTASTGFYCFRPLTTSPCPLPFPAPNTGSRARCSLRAVPTHVMH